MKIREIILEMSQEAVAQLEQVKNSLAVKIKQLPDDETTAKALAEIEDLLKHVNAGGRKGMIDRKLQEIGDPAVDHFRKLIATYVLSIIEDKPIKEREELFDLWKADKIVLIDKLLTKKMNNFSDVFNGYGKNSVITELIDDLMKINGYGQGKGELALNILSKSIHKPSTSYNTNLKGKDNEEENKGDLVINGKKYEVKTKDGGAARFVDQEVKPAKGYEAAAVELNQFIRNNKQAMPGVRLVKSGINAGEAINFYGALQDNKLKAEYLRLIEKNLVLIFGGEEMADRSTIRQLMNAVKTLDIPSFLQLFSVASLNYYLSVKKDEGIISFDLNNNQVTYYESAEDLANMKQRFHAETFYLGNNNPREVYPKLSIQPTTFGADAARKQNVAAYTQDLPQAQDPVELEQALQTIISDLADLNRITDPDQINDMMTAASDWLASQKNKQDIQPDALKKYLQKKGLLEPRQPQPDELDTMVKNAGITKPTQPAKPAQPGQATV